MNPIFELIYFETITPYMDGKLSAEIALDQGLSVLKEFMVSNTRVDTLNMFSKLSDVGPFEDKQSVPISIVLPAFITSELKTAFEIGFLIFLPFLVIDMVIASILMSLGMMMLSPMLISLPFKLLLFVLVDGWAMTVDLSICHIFSRVIRMAYDQNVQYLSLAFWQIIMTAGPILAIALGIGLLIGLIQAATSIQEMTLSFVPKLFVVLGAMALFATYTLSTMTDYFMFIFDEIALKGL